MPAILGVANAMLEDGRTISDVIAACAVGAENHGSFVSCVSHFAKGLKPRVITGVQKGAIENCTAQSDIGVLPCEFDRDYDASELEHNQNRHRAMYELAENDLVIPSLEIGEKQWHMQMKLPGVNSVNLHLKLQGITEVVQ